MTDRGLKKHPQNFSQGIADVVVFTLMSVLFHFKVNS